MTLTKGLSSSFNWEKSGKRVENNLIKKKLGRLCPEIDINLKFKIETSLILEPKSDYRLAGLLSYWPIDRLVYRLSRVWLLAGHLAEHIYP